MRLPVLSKKEGDDSPWFADGLRFTCTQCGNCCTGAPGYVWMSPEELQRLADHLQLSLQETVKKYGRRIGNRISLKENRNLRGEYDCVFLKEEPGPDGKLDPAKPGRRVCTIYDVRPLQCRTWPFWTGNLESPAHWATAGIRCPGINKGRKYDAGQIEALRDAEDWPDRAQTPSSTAKRER
jgi:Fe-S-cluster containining protein